MLKKINRHSIRLQKYDYSQAGAYCITICAKNRVPLMGEIIKDDLALNYISTIVDDLRNY